MKKQKDLFLKIKNQKNQMYEKNLTEDGRRKMLTLEMNGVCETKSKRNRTKALFFGW